MATAMGSAQPRRDLVSELICVTLRKRWGKFNAGETCGVDRATRNFLLNYGFLDDRPAPEPEQHVDPSVEVVNDSPQEATTRRKKWYRDRMQHRITEKA